MTILFLVYFGTHNNKIHTIYKENQCFCFDLLHVVVMPAILRVFKISEVEIVLAVISNQAAI
jgi:hypothetical protein